MILRSQVYSDLESEYECQENMEHEQLPAFVATMQLLDTTASVTV